MKRRTWILVVVGVAAAVAVYLVVDALVVTDEERISALVDEVSGEVSPDRIDRVLAWTDPARQPVEVTAFGQTALYEDAETLATRAHEGLRAVRGDTLRILGESIDVDGDRATVSLRFVSSQGGMMNAYFDLRKRDDRWLVEKVRVER